MGLFMSFVLGIAVGALILWMFKGKIMLKWYEWLMGIVGFVLMVIAVQHFFGSMDELYPTAGWLGLAIFGIPALVLLVLTWQMAARHQSAS